MITTLDTPQNWKKKIMLRYKLELHVEYQWESVTLGQKNSEYFQIQSIVYYYSLL